MSTETVVDSHVYDHTLYDTYDLGKSAKDS